MSSVGSIAKSVRNKNLSIFILTAVNWSNIILYRFDERDYKYFYNVGRYLSIGYNIQYVYFS